jgi:hypothetical protein
MPAIRCLQHQQTVARFIVKGKRQLALSRILKSFYYDQTLFTR